MASSGGDGNVSAKMERRGLLATLPPPKKKRKKRKKNFGKRQGLGSRAKSFVSNRENKYLQV